MELDDFLQAAKVVEGVKKLSVTKGDVLVITAPNNLTPEGLRQIRKAFEELGLPCQLLVKTKDINLTLHKKEALIKQLVNGELVIWPTVKREC